MGGLKAICESLRVSGGSIGQHNKRTEDQGSRAAEDQWIKGEIEQRSRGLAKQRISGAEEVHVRVR